MKKTLSIFTLIFSLFSVSSTALAEFSDVTESNPFYEAINYVQAEGIVDGHPDGTYKSLDPINRAAFTKIIIEAQFTDQEIESCGNADFPDVEAGIWYDKYVCVAQKNDVIDGYEDGTFQASNEINLAEAAKIIVKAFDYQTQENAVWFMPYITILEGKNAIPTTFTSFNQKVKRGEMASIIYRLHAGVTDKDSTTYVNLEKGIKAEKAIDSEIPTDQNTPNNKEEVTDNETPTDQNVPAYKDGAAQDVSECSYVESVMFQYDPQLEAYYGSFTFSGKVVTTQEDNGEHVWLEIEDNDRVTFSHYADWAKKMGNQGPLRFEEFKLYFQLGSLEDGKLLTYSDIDTSAEELINENLNSGEVINLKLAQTYLNGGGGDNYGISVSCSINKAY